MGFLELLLSGNRQPVAFNPQHVSAVLRDSAGNGTYVYTVNCEESFHVAEQYNLVMDLWKRALTVEV